MDFADFDWDRLDGLGFAEKTKDGLKSACWKGYEAIGMKTKNGRKVPNCVKKKKTEYQETLEPLNETTANFLPEEPVTGDKKNPVMGECSDYSETEDFSSPTQSLEANGSMAINQLRVMREKIDIMLGMIYPGDNLEPWMSTKLAMSSQNLASVADYIRYGVEFSEEEG